MRAAEKAVRLQKFWDVHEVLEPALGLTEDPDELRKILGIAESTVEAVKEAPNVTGNANKSVLSLESEIFETVPPLEELLSAGQKKLDIVLKRPPKGATPAPAAAAETTSTSGSTGIASIAAGIAAGFAGLVGGTKTASS